MDSLKIIHFIRSRLPYPVSPVQLHVPVRAMWGSSPSPIYTYIYTSCHSLETLNSKLKAFLFAKVFSDWAILFLLCIILLIFCALRCKAHRAFVYVLYKWVVLLLLFPSHPEYMVSATYLSMSPSRWGVDIPRYKHTNRSQACWHIFADSCSGHRIH